MLIVSRFRGEQTIITVAPSDKPTIIVHEVVDIRGQRTRNGFTAGKHVTVHRKEVQDRINRGEPRRPMIRLHAPGRGVVRVS